MACLFMRKVLSFGGDGAVKKWLKGHGDAHGIGGLAVLSML